MSILFCTVIQKKIVEKTHLVRFLVRRDDYFVVVVKLTLLRYVKAWKLPKNPISAKKKPEIFVLKPQKEFQNVTILRKPTSKDVNVNVMRYSPPKCLTPPTPTPTSSTPTTTSSSPTLTPTPTPVPYKVSIVKGTVKPQPQQIQPPSVEQKKELGDFLEWLSKFPSSIKISGGDAVWSKRNGSIMEMCDDVWTRDMGWDLEDKKTLAPDSKMNGWLLKVIK